MACWDLIGKALGKPVYELLATDNEPQGQIRVYASGGVSHEWYREDAAGVLIEGALRHKEAGYDLFKFRPGTTWPQAGMTLERYVPVLERLRAAVGPDFKLAHEGIGRQLGSYDAIVNGLAPVLEDLGFAWFEEAPGGTSLEHIDQFPRLKEVLRTVRVSGGERFRERFETQQWLDCGALEIVQTDCKVTSVTENWHIARMAHLRGITLTPHNLHGGGTPSTMCFRTYRTVTGSRTPPRLRETSHAGSRTHDREHHPHLAGGGHGQEPGLLRGGPRLHTRPLG